MLIEVKVCSFERNQENGHAKESENESRVYKATVQLVFNVLAA